MNSHTPGPWQITRPVSDSGLTGIGIAGQYKQSSAGQYALSIATIENSTLPDAESNARLIASAPDLLAALRACEALLDGRQPKDIPGALMVIRSALSKAKA